jgi:hypothetical protein
MNVRPIENVQLKEAPLQREDSPSEPLDKEKELSDASLGLHQVFNQDTLNQVPQEILSQAVEMEALTPTLWSKILSWWKEPEKTPASQPLPSSSIDALEMINPKPINPVPALEPPDNIPADLQAAQFPSVSKQTTKNLLTPSQITEGLALMNERTIESIMFILFKAQIELEKENANIAEGTFSKYLDFQKLQQKVLQEIKDILVKDEKVAEYFGKAQTLTMAAGFITGLAMAAMSFGLLGPVAGFIGTAAGPLAANTFMATATTIGTIGPAVTAGLTGLTWGSKMYFQMRFNEDKAKHEEYQYQEKYYDHRSDDSRERLMTIAEADSVFKECWIRLLKRSDKMRKIVLKK